MENRLTIEEIKIEHVRHLSGIDIPILHDPSAISHIIFTGKNGSGKTSLLDAIAQYIDSLCRGMTPSKLEESIEQEKKILDDVEGQGDQRFTHQIREYLEKNENRLKWVKNGISLRFNINENTVEEHYEQGGCVFAYFKAQRTFSAEEPQSIEKISFANHYSINDSPRELFIKYMLDLKMTQALALSNGKQEKADAIQSWFDGLRDILRDIYEDETLTIDFDEETYLFFINQEGKEPFTFNNASDGFSAVLEVVIDLMLRMQAGSHDRFNRDLPGIVLIDEIENHLHLSLQKRILPYLTQLFPNVQFVVSTHSPFVLSSIANATIYDLESGILIEDGMADNTYSSVVEGYFEVDALSKELREKYDREYVL